MHGVPLMSAGTLSPQNVTQSNSKPHLTSNGQLSIADEPHPVNSCDPRMGRRIRCFFWSIIAFSSLFYVTVFFIDDFWDNINLDGMRFEGSVGKGLRHLLEDGHSPNTDKRLPQCIIVGVRKGGTRALLEFLGLHSQIKPAATEIHFFDDDQKYTQGLEWYRKMMPYSYVDDITIEKSPRYFITPSVPKRIHDMNSSIKILVILRHPTQRVISDYSQVAANKQSKNMTFDKFEHLAIDRRTGFVNKDYKAISISTYYQHFIRWLKYFSRDQIHVVDGEKLVNDPVSEVRMVENFLNLPHQVTYKSLYYNETRGFFCMKTDKINQCLGKGKGRKHPKVSADVVEQLNSFFAPYNEKLFQMIGRRLDWV